MQVSADLLVMNSSWSMSVGGVCLLLFVVFGLAGCEATGSARRNVDVLYRFENLRSQAGIDDWAAVREVLNKHAAKPVTVQVSGSRESSGIKVATYEAKATLPSVRTIEAIQLDLERLRSVRGRGDRVEVFLDDVAMIYKGNFVAATVSVSVGGLATQGHRIRLFTSPSSPPVETVAGRNGLWRTSINVVPEAQWVYGLSQDLSGKLPNRYFRVNVSTQAQERLEEGEFLAMFPAALASQAPAGSAGSSRAAAAQRTPVDAKPGSDGDARWLRDQRQIEDETRRRQRNAEDAIRRKDLQREDAVKRREEPKRE